MATVRLEAQMAFDQLFWFLHNPVSGKVTGNRELIRDIPKSIKAHGWIDYTSEPEHRYLLCPIASWDDDE